MNILVLASSFTHFAKLKLKNIDQVFFLMKVIQGDQEISTFYYFSMHPLIFINNRILFCSSD